MCPQGPPPPSEALAERLLDNLRAVRARLARAAERCGRGASEIELVAVTKYVAPELAAALAATLEDAGETPRLGESRVQELERKRTAFEASGRGAEWHLIGHVQRNKARRATALAEVIHSVDSVRALEALERTAAEQGRRPRVYFELRLVDEPGTNGAGPNESTRTGFAPAELEPLLERARTLEALIPVGLMTMGPRPDSHLDADDPLERQAPARAVFARLAALRDGLRERHAGAFEDGRIALSMGMSSDLEAAVAEGSDVVRVGSALFAGIEHGKPGQQEKEHGAA